MSRHATPNAIIHPSVTLSNSPLNIGQQTLAAHSLSIGLRASDDDALANWVEDEWFKRQVHEAGAQTSNKPAGTK